MILGQMASHKGIMPRGTLGAIKNRFLALSSNMMATQLLVFRKNFVPRNVLVRTILFLMTLFITMRAASIHRWNRSLE
eukprot:9935730-Ditylum_brightwellii.AAC.1